MSCTLGLTPIVLLLLMIITQLALSLCSHAAFGLVHLLIFTWSWLVPLMRIKVLQIGPGMGPQLDVPHLFIIADGIAVLGSCTAQTGIYHDVSVSGTQCHMELPTEVGHWTSGAQHRH